MKSIYSTLNPARGWILTPVVLIFLLFSVSIRPAFAGRDGSSSEGVPAALEEKILENLQVFSIHAHENFLFINDERYIPTRNSRIVDERGKKASIRQIPKKGFIDLTFERRPKTEVMPYGPDEKILVEIRILDPRQQKDRKP